MPQNPADLLPLCSRFHAGWKQEERPQHFSCKLYCRGRALASVVLKLCHEVAAAKVRMFHECFLDLVQRARLSKGNPSQILLFPKKESIHEFYAASLLFRTFVYLYLSELLGCMYRGDALRAGLAKTIVGSHQRSIPSFSNVVLDALAADQEKRDEAVNQLLGIASFQVRLPPVAQAVLTRAKNAEEILRIALEIRASKQAERFRAFCKTVDQAIARGNRLEVEQAIRELQAFGLDLAKTQLEDTPTLQGPQELISYGSTLLTTILETAKHPVRSLRGRLRFRSLVFLDTLRSAPRNFAILDRLLA